MRTFSTVEFSPYFMQIDLFHFAVKHFYLSIVGRFSTEKQNKSTCILSAFYNYSKNVTCKEIMAVMLIELKTFSTETNCFVFRFSPGRFHCFKIVYKKGLLCFLSGWSFSRNSRSKSSIQLYVEFQKFHLSQIVECINRIR